MKDNHKGSRVKTEGDRLVAEIQRQKAIFNHLSWQDKQRDRKIKQSRIYCSFLKRYYNQLQEVIKKQQQEDSTLHQRVRLEQIKRRKLGHGHQSNVLKLIRYPESRKRLATELYQGQENETMNNSSFLDIIESVKSRNKK